MNNHPFMDIALTVERRQLEQDVAVAIQLWLISRVEELRANPDALHKARKPWKPWTVFDHGDRYKRQKKGKDPRATIKAGEELFTQILTQARNLGAKEAASALLKDPPRTFREHTRRELRILARKQIKMVDTTTRRMLRNVTGYGKPMNVDALLQKIYSQSRCQGIALDQVAKGYIRGAAEVLRQNGYRYIYARTLRDEKVCEDCQPHESEPMTIMQFVERYPRHPRCRCYPATTRADGTRDKALHAKSVMIEWEQRIEALR